MKIKNLRQASQTNGCKKIDSKPSVAWIITRENSLEKSLQSAGKI